MEHIDYKYMEHQLGVAIEENTTLRKENEELKEHIKRYLHQLKWFMENHPKAYEDMTFEALTPPQESEE